MIVLMIIDIRMSEKLGFCPNEGAGGCNSNFLSYFPKHNLPWNYPLGSVEVLHCNYNGDIGQKWHLVTTFDWGPY